MANHVNRITNYGHIDYEPYFPMKPACLKELIKRFIDSDVIIEYSGATDIHPRKARGKLASVSIEQREVKECDIQFMPYNIVTLDFYGDLRKQIPGSRLEVVGKQNDKYTEVTFVDGVPKRLNEVRGAVGILQRIRKPHVVPKVDLSDLP